MKRRITVTLNGDVQREYHGYLFAHLSTQGVLCIKSIETAEVIHAFAEGIWKQVDVEDAE